MVQLQRIGKDKVINHHHDVPYKVLNKSYTFGDENSGNKIIHGDNLEALKSLLPQYEGKIDCIYIDPPYNTGNEGRVYNDNVNDPRIKKWLNEVVGKEGEDLSRHDKWLCMMYPRIKLLQKLLSESGVIFISIDDNEQANLKLLCDEIFGGSNFVCSFIRRGGRRNLAKYISVSHEYMLCYAKNLGEISRLGISWKEKKKGLNRIYQMADELVKQNNGDYDLASKLLKDRYKSLPNDDECKDSEHYCRIDEKGVYFASDISKGGGGGPKREIKNPKTGNIVKTPSRGRSYAKIEDLYEDIKKGLVHFNGDGVPCKKRYLSENETQVLETVFYKDRRGSSKRLRSLMGGDVFEFPKDEQIIQHFFEIFTNKNSIILDSFAGSGTTAHSVLELNKEDGGNRKFILVELGDYAENITAERVKRVINGYGEGDKKVEGTGGGFDFYELGEPLFIDSETLNESVGEETLRDYIRYSETKTEIQKTDSDNKYYLGTNFDTDYYFYYEKESITELNYDYLAKIKREKNHGLIIYADICSLSDEFMKKNNIVFKKIPRDISQF